MNSRQIMAEVSRLATERGWPSGHPNETVLLDLISTREENRHALRSQLASLKRDVVRVEETLNQPSPLLNTLGELQQRPAAVEAYIGAFANSERTLRAFLKAHKPKGGSDA